MGDDVRHMPCHVPVIVAAGEILPLFSLGLTLKIGPIPQGVDAIVQIVLFGFT